MPLLELPAFPLAVVGGGSASCADKPAATSVAGSYDAINRGAIVYVYRVEPIEGYDLL